MIVQMQHKRGTAAEFAAADPILKQGEWGYETTNKIVKIGDGVTKWSALATPFAADTYSRTQSDARYPQRTDVGYDNFESTGADALRPFWAAYANAEYAGTDIVFIGDSHVEGEGMSRHGRQFVAKFHERLRARRALAGVVGARAGYNWISPGYLLDRPDNPVASGAGTVFNAFGGFGYKMAEIEPGETLTFTTVATSAQLVIRASTTTSSASVKVDSGAATTVTTSATSTDYFKQLQPANLTGLGGTSHTVTITGVGGTTYVLGLQVFNGDENAGLRVWNVGRGGIKAQDYAQTFDGLNGLALIKPSLVFIELGHNDLGMSSRTPAQFKADMVNIIGRVQSWANFTGKPVSIGIIGMYAQGDGLGGLNPGWAGYNAVLKEIADADPTVFFVDLWARFLNAAQSSGTNPRDAYGLVNGDSTHMTDKGHSLVADILVRAVLPR